MGNSTLSMVVKAWISKMQENSKILQKWYDKNEHTLVVDYYNSTLYRFGLPVEKDMLIY